MKKSLTALLLICLILTCAAAFQQAGAASRAIIVPDNYPSITAAIANAKDGDVIYVRNGFYNESALVINKAIMIQGEDIRNTIVHLYPPLEYWDDPFFGGTHGSPGSCINITASNVKISDLTIWSTGGIYGNADNITIVSNIITTKMSGHFTGSNLTISRNTLYADQWTMMGHNLTLSQNMIDAHNNGVESNGDHSIICQNNINGSLWLRSSFSVITDNIYDLMFIFYGDSNLIINNSGELSLGNSMDSCSNNVVSGNIMKGPSVWGIWIGSHCRNNVFYDNYIADEGYFQFGPQYCSGVIFFHDSGIGTNNSFYHNVFVNNSVNVKFYDDAIAGGNFWDNGVQGNYWSDYNGSDANGDGVGDTAYVINSQNSDEYPLMSPFDMPTLNVPLPVYDPPIEISQALLTQTSTSTPTPNPTQLAINDNPAAPSTTPNGTSSQQTGPEFVTEMVFLVVSVTALIALLIVRSLRKPKP